MTRQEILRRFPNASEAFIQANLAANSSDHDPRPHAEPQRDSGHALARTSEASPPRSAAVPRRTLVQIRSFGVRLLDKDNLYGGAKPYCDALRYCGAIRDDAPDAIELEVTQEKVAREEEERVVITLTQIE